MPRKTPKTAVVAFKVEEELADFLNKLPNKSAFIRKAIAAQMSTACPLCNGSGQVSRFAHDHYAPMGASPILAGGLVVLACDQSRGSFVAAFDAKSGRERWRAPRPEALSGHATLVVLAPPGARPQLIVPGSFRLDAYDLESGASVWFANGLPSEMKSGAVLGDGTVYVVGYSSPLNEPGKHPSLPRYAEWVAAQDQDKDGKVTKAEADRTTQVFWDFIDLDRDGSISESEWHTNEAMMAAENGLLAFKSDGRGDVTRSGLMCVHDGWFSVNASSSGLRTSR